MFCSSFYYAQILLCKLWKVKMLFSKTPNFKEPDGLKRTKYIIVRYDAQLRKAMVKIKTLVLLEVVNSKVV